MSAPSAVPDASRCPLCGGANSCAMAGDAAPAGDCWCRSVTFTPELLVQVPVAQRGQACICLRCATQAAAAPALPSSP